jgi:hypothetical protein
MSGSTRVSAGQEFWSVLASWAVLADATDHGRCSDALPLRLRFVRDIPFRTMAGSHVVSLAPVAALMQHHVTLGVVIAVLSVFSTFICHRRKHSTRRKLCFFWT